MSVAAELETLADQIEKACADAPCMSVAREIVHDCVDHLRLLAAHKRMVLRLERRSG
jgi:hypothetical protein